MTQKEILEKLVSDLESLQSKIPNGHFIHISESVDKMKGDISDLKRTLLNPENGVIVKINKVLEENMVLKQRVEDLEDRTQVIPIFQNWKHSVSRALWIIFSALVGIILQIILFSKQMNS